MSELLNEPHNEYVESVESGADGAFSAETLMTLATRLTQSSESRLSEYVTGFSLEEPEIVGRTLADCRIIRGKYGFPALAAATKYPGRYEDFLRDVAAREGIEIVDRSACGSFFSEFPNAAAAFFDEHKRAGVTIDKSQYNTYIRSLFYLEHEIIHGIQFNRTPSMPIEVMEYEAYTAEGDFTDLDNTFRRANGSVRSWYKQLSEKAEKPVLPEWDSIDYFLREVDGVTSGASIKLAKKAIELLRRGREQRNHQQNDDATPPEINLGEMEDAPMSIRIRPL